MMGCWDDGKDERLHDVFCGSWIEGEQNEQRSVL